jgi:type I restriction enzyme S subunit
VIIDSKQLPVGWSVSTIEEIADVNPRLNKAGIPDDLFVSFVSMPAVGAADGSIDVSEGRLFGEVKKGFTAFQEGDVLFAKITPCMENGKMAIVPQVKNGIGFGSTEFHVLRPKEGIDARYIYYYVSSKNFRGEAERYMSGAVGQKRVTTPYLKECEIPVAPPDQQKRIVAEIEKQFSRLDEAVANLKRVKANLKRYKAAVLKAAVEGKLTEEWRKQHPDIEPASKLLERILAERRQKWEETELAKMKAKGITPKDDKWKKKYKEQAKPDTTSLPELPEGWVWATVQQLADVQLGKMLDKEKHRAGTELPYLRNKNVRWGSVETMDLLNMFFKESELERYGLQAGDVLVCEGGEPGRAAVWDGHLPGMMYQKALHRVRFLPGYEQKLLIFLLEYLAKSGRLERWFTGSTIKHFTGESFAQLPIPVASNKEQLRIVEEVDRRLSLVSASETQVDINLKRAERLRQSILSKAFSGQLIYNDLADSLNNDFLPILTITEAIG